MSACLLIEERYIASLPPDHRRLSYCTAVAALLVAGILSMFDWSTTFEDARSLLLVVDLLPRPQREDHALERPAEQAAVAATQAEPVVEQLPRVETTEEEQRTATPAVPADAGSAVVESTKAPAEELQPAHDADIDWQAALESASEEIIRQHNEAISLHPDFDELRRVAKERYAPPDTRKPPPIWENVEQDIYGRTLLRQGDCFRILDDTNVGNRYAFETFERFLVFCDMFSKRRPQEFPWIETIKERYPYLRYPDGEIPLPEKE